MERRHIYSSQSSLGYVTDIRHTKHVVLTGAVSTCSQNFCLAAFTRIGRSVGGWRMRMQRVGRQISRNRYRYIQRAAEAAAAVSAGLEAL